MNRSKIEGTKAETSFVRYLRLHGWPYAERRALSGNKDLGDTTGHPGLVFEVKAEKDLSYPGAMRETEIERRNAKAEYGVMIHKPRLVGHSSVQRWHAVMDADQFGYLASKADADDRVHLVSASARGLNLKGILSTAQVVAGVTKLNPFAIGGVLVETNRVLPNYVVLYVEDLLALLRQAGYGTAIDIGEKKDQ